MVNNGAVSGEFDPLIASASPIFLLNTYYNLI